MKDWGLGLDTEKPIIISGPCSAESEEQVMQSCLGVAQQGANMLRAGIWKPRTRPGAFEGIGSEGLPWLKAAGRATGLPVTVEVANARHVYEALRNHVDVLWVGARTTVNPFSVQEIADALRGVDIPVLVKNPVNPDLALWMGSLERFHKVGIKKLAAIHRGFSVTNSAPYRNLPMWEVVIELRRQVPGLEIICDPSHIAGSRPLLRPIAQKALDLNFDGLMIESHINPDVALSDAQQQVTPSGLGELLGSLVKRRVDSNDPLFIANLEALRSDIDKLDREILELLGKRMEVAREIGLYKKENGITILQISRWQEIMDSRLKAAMAHGLTEKFATSFLQDVHNESIRQQEQVMDNSMVG
jgi:chorismate mutase